MKTVSDKSALDRAKEGDLTGGDIISEAARLAEDVPVSERNDFYIYLIEEIQRVLCG